ncbi:dTDP-4-dehydrorhamnose 3,5-epimerase [Pseudoduganella lurida]|uniref:dTDP-4-dehydrorhamnose 3,5-epimerase n=2 Tax=Pseudoduganella lurida TaxID=1036180 RepID=A0A562R9X1_9BURK|nr:dTDP-4-dehydrorhamnose 3,5-epimerase [Pseudoduganella lurida]
MFDVDVDLRKASPMFGQWFGLELLADNKPQLWIPPEFAHAFAVISDRAQFLCKPTVCNAPEQERAILWNDPAVGID